MSSAVRLMSAFSVREPSIRISGVLAISRASASLRAWLAAPTDSYLPPLPSPSYDSIPLFDEAPANCVSAAMATVDSFI